MGARVKRSLLLAAGWFFFVLGIAGLFLPVLQGVLFIVIGLVILSSEYVWAHHLLKKLEQRFPHLAERAHRGAERVHNWFHRRRVQVKATTDCERR